MWKNALAVLSLTLVAIVLAVSQVEACSCVTGPQGYREHVRKQFGEAYAIFSAEAIAVGREAVTFRVDDVWKGELPRELSIEAAPDPNLYPTAQISSCDYLFKAGTRYLIFTYGSSVATMKTKSCTPTGDLMMNAAVSILDELVPVRSKPKG